MKEQRILEAIQSHATRSLALDVNLVAIELQPEFPEMSFRSLVLAVARHASTLGLAIAISNRED